MESQGFRRDLRPGLGLQVNQRARSMLTLEAAAHRGDGRWSGRALTRTDSGELASDRGAARASCCSTGATLRHGIPGSGVTAGQVARTSWAPRPQPARRLELHALGSQANTNAWLVDGIDNNEFTFNTVIVQPNGRVGARVQGADGDLSADTGRGWCRLSSMESATTSGTATSSSNVARRGSTRRTSCVADRARRRRSTGTSSGRVSRSRSSRTRRSSS